MDTFKNKLQIKIMKIQLFSMLYLFSTLVICKTIPVQVIERSSTSRGPYLIGKPYFIDEGNSFVGKIPFNGREIYSLSNLRPQYFLNAHTVHQLPLKYNQLKTVNTFVPNIIFDRKRTRKSPSKLTLLKSQSQKYQLYPIHRVITEFIPKLYLDNGKNEKGKVVNEFSSHGQYDLNSKSGNEEHLIENLYGRSGSIKQVNLESDSDSKEINILDDEVTPLQTSLNIEADYTPVAKSYVEEELNKKDINSKNDQHLDASECDSYLKQVGNEPHNSNDLKKYILELIYGLTEKVSSEACEETNANEGDSIDAGVDDSERLDISGQADIDRGEDIYDGAEIHANASIDEEASTTEGANTDRGAGINGGIEIHGEPGISDGIGISRRASIDVGVGISEKTGIQEDANFSTEAVYGGIAGKNGLSESYKTADVNGEVNISGQAGIHSDVRLNAETSEGVNISEGTANHNSTAIYEDSAFQGDANILVGVDNSGQSKKFEKLSGTDVNISEGTSNHNSTAIYENSEFQGAANIFVGGTGINFSEDLSITRGSEINEGVAIDGETQRSNGADLEKETLKDGGASVTSEESFIVGGVSISRRASAYGKGKISEGVAHLTRDDVSKDVVDDGSVSIIEEKSSGGEAETSKISGISEGIDIGSERFFGGMRSIYGESGNHGQAKLYSAEGMSEGIGDEAGINHKKASIKKEIGVSKGADNDDGLNIGVGSNIGEGSIIDSEAGSEGGTRISTYKAKKGKGLLKVYKTVYIYHS